MAKSKTTKKAQRRTTTTQPKKKQTKPTPVTLSNQMIYRIVGIMLIFMSLLGLFQWGAVGLLVGNSFRLFVGETYSLLLGIFIVSGIYLLIRGEQLNVSFQPVIGGFFVMSALTTLLHFNQFYGQEPLPQSIFNITLQLFRTEFTSGQMSLSLGGGLLGALYYATCSYLFGRWGTYLLVAILFISGMSLLLRIPIKAWGHGVTRLAHGVKHLGAKLFPEKTPETARVSADEQVTIDQPVVHSGYDVEADVAPTSTSRKGAWTQRLTERFFGFEEEEDFAEQPDDNQYESVPTTRMRPIAEREEMNSRRSQPASAPILDLGHLTNPASTVYDEGTTELDMSAIEARETVPIVMATSYSEVEDDAEAVSAAHEHEVVEQSVAAQPAANEQAAGHWQAHAHQRQELTQDDLAETLAEAAPEVTTPTVKPTKRSRTYQLPSKKLLKKIPPVDQSEEYARINENIEKLERTFESFGVQAKVVKANLGPSVTKYEIQPAIGVKVSKIVSLSDDIALALAARDVRVEAPIPGKSLIGIEVPNTQVSPVSFWEIIDAALESPNLLEVPLGRDISGTVCLADLSKMPHLLIAGATGSGKSVGMNVIIVSLLMKAKPDEVKFLMIDPKKVELTMYDGVPHLLAPVVTNPRKAAQALNKVVQEMERRYELFASTGVRNIDGFNEQVERYNEENGTGYERMPKIVVFVDELADLMMVASNEVENAIIRLAQMARAAGIHMIIATQRPSVDVITGIIKANVPSRLAFAVSSGIDSRTILDSNGAEKLLGRGDMLFQPMGKNKPVRVQGAYISDSEVDKITQFVKQQQEAEYDETMIISDDEASSAGSASDDEYFEETVALIRGLETVSISQLQRKFRIGYNRAARLIDDLEAQGYIGSQDGSKPRQVFIREDD